MTSPFFTRPRGIASLTDTTMMSPTEAYLRLRAAQHLDAHDTARAGIVGDVEIGLHLDHGDRLLYCAARSRLRGLPTPSFMPSGLARPGSRVQRLCLEIGCVSSIHTTSPTLANSFFSSWAWILLGAAHGLLHDRMGEAALDPHHDRLVVLVGDHDALQHALRHDSRGSRLLRRLGASARLSARAATRLDAARDVAAHLPHARRCSRAGRSPAGSAG